MIGSQSNFIKKAESKSTRPDPQRAVMESLLRHSAKILEEIFVNSATTLNPLNPGIDKTGKKAILQDCIEKHRYFDFVKSLCLFRHGDKFIFDCHDKLMELLINTTELEPDEALWRSMGVLAEAPGNEPGISSLNRLNVIEPRQDKIIHRIIKKISAEIKMREGQTPSPDNSVSQIELTMEESSRFRGYRGYLRWMSLFLQAPLYSHLHLHLHLHRRHLFLFLHQFLNFIKQQRRKYPCANDVILILVFIQQ